MNLQEFIRPELLTLVAMLWVLGYVLKKHPKFTAEWMIPFILVGVGVIATVVYVGCVVEGAFSMSGIVSSVVQGILVAGAAVLINEGVKQITKKKVEDQSK